MTTITSAQQAINTATRNALEDIERATAQLKAVQDPTFERIVQVNPDANVYFSSWSRELVIEVHIQAVPAPTYRDSYPIDISEYPDVSAGSDGYRLDVDETLGTLAGWPVKRRIVVEQAFTPDEKTLLRACGKLSTRTSTFDTLTCNV